VACSGAVTVVQMVPVELRQATTEDTDFCLALHEATMRSFVERLYGPWDQEVQQGFHDRWFKVETIQIISVGGRPVGVIGIERRDNDTYITRIEVHPEWQNRGIGTQVLQLVWEEVTRCGRSVSLHVFKENRAQALYERMGFRQVSEDGDRVLMRATVSCN